VAAALVAAGVVLALVVGIGFFARVVAHEELPVPAISGAWFIPIVVLVLVPSGVARSIALQPTWSSTTALALSTAAWGAGLVLFLLLAPVITWRLITAPSPPPHMAASWWIWLAPAGAGGLGLVALSRLAATVLGEPVAGVAPTFGLLGSSALWGFAVWWALFAGVVVRRTARAQGGLPFHLGSWGFAFPTAAVAALTIVLGEAWGSSFLSVVGAVAWFATLLVWGRLAAQTVAALRSGAIFTR
jgi:tellurite resistance protein TehA-like permease